LYYNTIVNKNVFSIKNTKSKISSANSLSQPSLETALDILFESCRFSQTTFGRTQIMPIDAYIEQFCTIRMMSSRRSGHTTAMSNFINKSDLRWAVLVPNSRMISRIEEMIVPNKRILLNGNQVRDNTYETFTIEPYLQRQILSIRVDGVFIDCASTYREEAIRQTCICFERAMRENPEKYFILIG
jgi:hypothetical protein